jgi:hypothetical protein
LDNTQEIEACILFAFHKVDALTVVHLALMQKHNPNIPIIPITDNVTDYLPGAIDVQSFPDPWPKTNPWRRCDTMLYRWFLNRTFNAKRYFGLNMTCYAQWISEKPIAMYGMRISLAVT